MRLSALLLIPVLMIIFACNVPIKQILHVERAFQRPEVSMQTEQGVGYQPLPKVWGGANQHQLWFQPAHRRQTQLAAMREADLRVLRIILGHRDQSIWWEDPPDPYTFEEPIGFFHEETFQQVDQLITECREFGIRLIIAFGIPPNYFAEFGDWDFYVSAQAQRAYLNRIRQCLLRIHSPSGVMWKDIDDVIWAWEIANEPGINLKEKNLHSPEETTAVLRSWLSLCATTIYALDPDTPVSLGTAGHSRYYGLNCGDDLRDLGNIPHVDIYTLHFYGGDLVQWIRDAKTVTIPYGKLLLVEEFGNQRKIGYKEQTKNCRYVTDICNTEAVPWMFWKLGHQKDGDSWSIMSDDPVWHEVIVPATKRLRNEEN
ncbi:MAG: cellulase family glycosylhydrolase [bacterium]